MRVSLLSHVLIIAGSIIIFHLYGASSYYIRRSSPNQRQISPRRSFYNHQKEYMPNDLYQDQSYYMGSSTNYWPYNNNMQGYGQGYNQQYWNRPYAPNVFPGNFIPYAPPTILIIKAESCIPPEHTERPASNHGITEEPIYEHERPEDSSTAAVVPEPSTASPIQNSTIPGSQLNVTSPKTDEKPTTRRRSDFQISNPESPKVTRRVDHLNQIARAAAALSHPQGRALQFSFVDGKLSLNSAQDELGADAGRATSYVVVDLGRDLKETN